MSPATSASTRPRARRASRVPPGPVILILIAHLSEGRAGRFTSGGQQIGTAEARAFQKCRQHTPTMSANTWFFCCTAYGSSWPIPAVTSILSARQLYGDKLPIKFFGDLANSVFADLTPVRHLFGGAREAPRCERLRSGSGWTAGARQRRAMLKLVACGIAQQSADSLMAAWPKSSST